MPHYVRADIPGGTFFFTVALLERRRRLLVENIGTLREAFRGVRHRHPFTFVVRLFMGSLPVVVGHHKT